MEIRLHNGQCGLCKHFGEEHPRHGKDKLVQIRSNSVAPEDFQEDCGHPAHSQLNLVVTASSGCDGFVPA